MSYLGYEPIANRLSRAQCEMLLEHIDGSRWVDAMVDVAKTSTRRGLMVYGLIEYRLIGQETPKFTYITEKGRVVLALLLSNYADALIAVGYGLVQNSEIPPQIVEAVSVKTASTILPEPQNNGVAVGAD